MPSHLTLVPEHAAPAPAAPSTGRRWSRAVKRSLRTAVVRLRTEERGAVTAEYAIVILAAVAFAGLLVAIMQSAEIRAMLVQLVENALGSGS